MTLPKGIFRFFFFFEAALTVSCELLPLRTAAEPNVTSLLMFFLGNMFTHYILINERNKHLNNNVVIVYLQEVTIKVRVVVAEMHEVKKYTIETLKTCRLQDVTVPRVGPCVDAR